MAKPKQSQVPNNTTERNLIRSPFLYFLSLILIVVLGIFAIGFGANSLTILFIQEKLSQFLIADLIRVVGISLYVFIITKYFYKKELFSTFKTSKPLRQIFIGLLLGSAMITTVYFILFYTKSIRQIQPTAFADYHFIIFVIIVSSLCTAFWEELIMRGFFLQRLLDHFSKVVALVISSAFFGVAHLLGPSPSFLTVISTFLAGLLLGLAFLKTRNLILPIALHFSWNCLQQLLLSKRIWQTEILNPLLAGTATVEDGVVAILVIAFATICIYFTNINLRCWYD